MSKDKTNGIRKLNVLDLFAGCGGLSKGFEKAGFNILAANEFWFDAAQTHRMNHPGSLMIEGDITDPSVKKEIISKSKGQVDVVIGGPPCQAYSMAGKRDPNDPRGKLFEDYIDVVKAVMPPFFVIENVKGMLTIKHERDNLTRTEKITLGKLREELETEKKKDNPKKLREIKTEIARYEEKVLSMIERKFKKLGYVIRYEVLNAANFGIPQRRERVILIGTNTGKEIVFPEPTHNGKWKTVREAIDDLKEREESKELHHILPVHSSDFLKKIRNTPIGKSVFETYRDAFFRSDPELPSLTVKENHNGVFVHYEKDRVMTARELARLQDFDDSFLFYGTKSSVLKQIGNAVPVGLAAAIGKAVKKMLRETIIK